MLKNIHKSIAVVLLTTSMLHSTNVSAQQVMSGQNSISGSGGAGGGSNSRGGGFSRAPIITVGGFIDFAGTLNNQNDAYTQTQLPDAIKTKSGTVISTTSNSGTPNKNSQQVNMANDSQIYFKVAGISDSGIKYGSVVELNAGTTDSTDNLGFNASKSYLFSEMQFGKIEIGNNISAGQSMKVDAATFARAAGGIGGSYIHYINMPMIADESDTQKISGGSSTSLQDDLGGGLVGYYNIQSPRFVMIPQLPTGHGGYARGFNGTSNDYMTRAEYDAAKADVTASTTGSVQTTLLTGLQTRYEQSFNYERSDNMLRQGDWGDIENATKITYYTPRISGIQGGISYAPDTGNRGTSRFLSGKASGDISNLISYGVNYANLFGNLGIIASLTGEQGSYENPSTTQVREDLAAYALGFNASYLGLTLGGSIGTWGRSLMETKGTYSIAYGSKTAPSPASNSLEVGAVQQSDATYQTAGLAYQFGPFATSLTYLTSTFQSNTYEALSFGVDYKLAKGLLPYFEITSFNFQSNQNAFDTARQSVFRQVKDNDGFVAIVGTLFTF